MIATEAPRVELFRLLGDEDRLRLLALCAHEELAVGELAELLKDSQPQVSRKVAPLRQAGLLTARKDGTRTLLSADLPDDAVVHAAVEEGRRLCRHDGSLARVAKVVRAREDQGRRFFETLGGEVAVAPEADAVTAFLPLLAGLLGNPALCVDVGAGEGTLLPLLSPLFARVVAVDRSAAQLARCAAAVDRLGLSNVRLLEGSAFEGTLVHEEVSRLGGADVVMVVRTLHHAARPAEAVLACARLLAPGGRLVVADYLPHESEDMRELGDVWLGFPPPRLAEFAQAAGLSVVHQGALNVRLPHAEPDAALPFQLLVAQRTATTNAALA